jgi:hypothetical protein
VASITIPSTDFFGKPRPDSGNANHFDIGAVEFQGTATALGPPTVTGISPTMGGQNQTVVVTLTGTNLGTITQVNLTSANGIMVSNVTPLSSTQVQATFTIAANAQTTGRSVTVFGSNGASGCISGSMACTFTVIATPKPTLTSIGPASGEQGLNVPVVLTGAGFTTTGSMVGITGPGVTIQAGSLTVVSSTQINATFTIASNATANHNITVTTPAGTSGNVTFTVGPLTAPVLSGIAPSSANHPTSGTVVVPVTLTGANFTTGTTLAISPNTGITVGPLTVVDSSKITTTFTISSTAPTTPRSVTVTTSAGSSVPVTFTVN